MDIRIKSLVLLLITFNFSLSKVIGQSNFKKENTSTYDFNDSTNVYRSGAVGITHRFQSAQNNKLLITEKYKLGSNRGLYLSLNEPNLIKNILDTSFVGLAEDSSNFYQAFRLKHFANFKSGKVFTSNEINAAEFSFHRGISDSLGFRDGGVLKNASVLKLSGNFDNNNRSYKTKNFSLLDLNFSTGTLINNTAEIDSFYAIKVDKDLGSNGGVLKKAWGLYIKPSSFNNYIAGNLGIGTDSASHKLTIYAQSNPLKIKGLQVDTNAVKLLTVDTTGAVSVANISKLALKNINKSTWKTDTSNYSFDETGKIWRSGSVSITDKFRTTSANKLMVMDDYRGKFNRGVYFSINEPNFNFKNDTIKLKVQDDSTAVHNTFVANHYMNLKENLNFRDVHYSTAEFNMFRGIRDSLGFADGGRVYKNAVIKVAANFSLNQRAYRTDEMDLINLRLFTTNGVFNPATIDRFYGIRLEDLRGTNQQMIQKGWGIYMKPSFLANFFGGKVGIGTDSPSHWLTIDAVSDPLKIKGLAKADTAARNLLSINAEGIVSKMPISEFKKNLAETKSFFVSLPGNDTVIMSDQYEIYIHKGGLVEYILPDPSTRAGKTWRITNVGTNRIILNYFFYEGNDKRTTILPSPGAYSYEIFSDGTCYIAID